MGPLAQKAMLVATSLWLATASLVLTQDVRVPGQHTTVRIGDGINLDVSHPNGFPKAKIAFDSAQCRAIKTAGFQSVRFFISPTDQPEALRPRIDEAIKHKLTVVICLWGKARWAANPDKGVEDFVAAWKKIGAEFKDYSSQLVFELLNEPGALVVEKGKPDGIKDGKVVMAFLNAAIPAIRETNPKRILAIGGPGLNGGRELMEYVTPKYLTYRLRDGSGFAADRNIIGVFHMYEPHSFTHWTKPLSEIPEWKASVSEQFEHATNWSKRWNKSVMLSEWGAWKPPKHSVEDFRTYLTFVTAQCRSRRITSMYYCAGFNDEWPFNILDSNTGWHQPALEIITGSTQSKTVR